MSDVTKPSKAMEIISSIKVKPEREEDVLGGKMNKQLNIHDQKYEGIFAINFY